MAQALNQIAAGRTEPDRPVTVSARELTDLLLKLQSQPLIEEAKGVVMGYYGVTADIAFRVLQRWSQHSNIKLRTVAQILVDSVSEQPCSTIAPHEALQRAAALTLGAAVRG